VDEASRFICAQPERRPGNGSEETLVCSVPYCRGLRWTEEHLVEFDTLTRDR